MYNVKQDENKFTNNYINKYNTKTFLKIYHSKYKEKKFRKLINLIGSNILFNGRNGNCHRHNNNDKRTSLALRYTRIFYSSKVTNIQFS